MGDPLLDVQPYLLRTGNPAGTLEDKGTLLRATLILQESDASLRQFWADLAANLLGTIAAFVDAQHDAGELPPGPPGSKELVRVLFAMLYHTGYEISLRPHTRAEEQRLVDAAATVIYRSVMRRDF